MFISLLRKYGKGKVTIVTSAIVATITVILVLILRLFLQGYIDRRGEIIAFILPLVTTQVIVSKFSDILLILEKTQNELYQVNMILRENNNNLKQLSTIDALTGINNRRIFDETLSKELKRGVRNRIPLSVIIIDIDSFKQYNDNYGHIKGDHCLKKIAQAIKKNITRSTDMVARYGGDEFIMILPNTDYVGVKKVAGKILDIVHNLKILHEYSSYSDRVTISMGCITNLNYELVDAEKLVALADKELYYIKQNGRNGFKNCIYPSNFKI